MKVLGIDPGYERLGVAVIEKENGKERVVYSDCVRTDKDLPFGERLVLLASITEHLIETYTPTVVALEKVFFAKNQKTATSVAEVRGVLLYSAARRGLTTLEYTPLEIKMTITGYGAATKKQVADMVERLVALPPKRRIDDEFDAIAVALTAIAKLPTVYPQK